MKIRVPLWGAAGRFAQVDPKATEGATIGVNVYNPDGSLFEPAAAATPAQEGVSVTLWRLIREVPAPVVALAGTSGTGLFAVTGDGTGALREIAASSTIVWTNPDGVAGNPSAALADLADTGTGTFKLITRDAKGRVEGTEDGDTDDVPEGATNLYFTAARAKAAAVEDALANGVTDVAPSQNAVFDALALKEPAGAASAALAAAMAYTVDEVALREPVVAAGTTGQFYRGDKTWSNWLDGDFRVGTSTGLFGSGREFAVSAGTSGDNLAHFSLQGSRTSGVATFSAVNFYHQATRVAALSAFRDGADDAGGFTITTKATGAATAVAFQVAGDRHWRPGADNVSDLGNSTRRMREIFCSNSTINTSDAREKTPPRSLTPAEIAAALDLARLPCIFQWLHAIEEKGEAARLHASPTVQSVIATFERHGLDPFRYGMVCHDTWEEMPEVWEQIPGRAAVIDEATGAEIEPAIPPERVMTQPYLAAGDRFSLRGTELAHFIQSALVVRQDELANRLAALEAK